MQEPFRYCQAPAETQLARSLVDGARPYIPPSNFFTKESIMMDRQYTASQRRGDIVRSSIERSMMLALENTAIGIVAMGLLKDTESYQQRLQSLHQKSIALVGFAHMWTELTSYHATLTPTYNRYGVSLYIDMPGSRLHIDNDYHEEITGLGGPSPHEHLWLEGESVFVECVTPALPSPGLQIENLLGNTAKYTSLLPHLKVASWLDIQDL